MRRPRPASRGMRLSPIPREVGTCVSHDVAVWQRVRDGRQIREGRGQSHEGESGLPRPRGGQGAWDLPEWVPGVCSPATWRRASSGHAGGRREAEEARRPHLASLPPTSRLTTRVNGGEGIIQTEASELFQGFRANTIQNQYLPGMGWRHR